MPLSRSRLVSCGAAKDELEAGGDLKVGVELRFSLPLILFGLVEVLVVNSGSLNTLAEGCRLDCP